MQNTEYPAAIHPEKIGTYPAAAKSGGGYVWDEVLEYRVWCYPSDGADDDAEGDDYYYVFATHDEACRFAERTAGAQEPLALIRQLEHINEPEPGQYVHVREERIAEWPAEFLTRPRRTEQTIAEFLSPDAPSNRLEILRGHASPD